MVENIITDGSFLGSVLAIVAASLGTLGKIVWDSLKEQRRIRRRLEGDENDSTQPGFLVETEETLEHIEHRLDTHDQRFDDIDGKLDTIVSAVNQNGHVDREIETFDRSRWENTRDTNDDD